MADERDEELRSLQTSLAYAALSGAWVVSALPANVGMEGEAPPDLPIFSMPSGGPLSAIREQLGDCKRCKLHHGRTHLVFGVGNPEARLMFVGEGPGEEEDKRGEPFVGAAGQLLDKMIAAIGYDRKSVYIANIVKCRPPQNRAPEPDEIKTCLPFLREQIEAVNPAVVVALGAVAAQALLETAEPISKMRGKFVEALGCKVLPTFHPAYLLRSPEKKREAWVDLQLARDEVERAG